MASRTTQRNTRRIYARPETEPSGPAIAIAPRGPGARGGWRFDLSCDLRLISGLSQVYLRFISA